MFHVKQFEKLKEFAVESDIIIGRNSEEKFGVLCSLLIETNKKLNLTAIEDPDEIETKHFIDSLSSAPLINRLWSEQLFGKPGDILMEDAGFSLIDVGTGAGFPGLPLKVVFPKAKFVLMDSLAKRINFVNQAIKEMELEDIEAVAARAEDLAKPGSVSRETFDFCVTRAVTNSAVLAEYCLPFVRVGGFCILYKSGDYEKELDEADAAIRLMGGKVVDVVTSKLYGTDADRSLVLIRKIKATPEKYPRRPGKPSKSPIKSNQG